jgi:adenosylcobinamide kinase / adenosylcobinamide-phosphate guanylyltransferase
LATAAASDREMSERIEIHRQERGSSWITIEEPLELASVLESVSNGAVVVDCLTLWLSNLMLAQLSDQDILIRISHAVEITRSRQHLTVLVTNEVGLGIVPDNELARRFRDLSGQMNQKFAASADAVIFMVSGLPFYLKGGHHDQNP